MLVICLCYGLGEISYTNWCFEITEQETKLTSTAGGSTTKICDSDVCS